MREREKDTMRESSKVMSWVVYRMTLRGKPDQMNAVCGRQEWDAMEKFRPGYYTLIQADILSEATAEKLARGTWGEARAGRGSTGLGTYVRPARSGASPQVPRLSNRPSLQLGMPNFSRRVATADQV